MITVATGISYHDDYTNDYANPTATGTVIFANNRRYVFSQTVLSDAHETWRRLAGSIALRALLCF